jgi:hypothetical protein
MNKLVTFPGIQKINSYNRLPELSMYWKKQLDSGNVLGIIQQVMSREPFRHAGTEESFKRLVVRDPIVEIRSLVDVLIGRFQQLDQLQRFKASTRVW